MIQILAIGLIAASLTLLIQVIMSDSDSGRPGSGMGGE